MVMILSLPGLLVSPVKAGVVVDGTLGPQGGIAGPNYAITGNLGKQVGSNLFHSFSEFNINKGQSATFSGPGSVHNVVGRVTGGGCSTIDGGINCSIQGANLYLVNPGGMVFGPNASLNVSGSFHASTADYLVLSDGGRFDAAHPENSVLTTAPPSAFGFLNESPLPISRFKEAIFKCLMDRLYRLSVTEYRLAPRARERETPGIFLSTSGIHSG